MYRLYLSDVMVWCILRGSRVTSTDWKINVSL